MSDINTDINKVFDNAVSSRSFFNPSSKDSTTKKNVANVTGEFYGHMIEAEQREVEFTRDGDKFKAIVFNYKFVVHKSNAKQTYDSGATGKDYVGRKYNANGIFRFIEPNEGDDFKSNQGGNKSYFRFCETLKIDCPTKKVEIDGEEVEVKELPHLSVDEINNKAVIAFIDKGKQYKDRKTGETRTPHVVKFVKEWEGGADLDEEIPF
tara:strand:- start:4134 stop:4757 length:624 start_codon:yes stop_codon:yes gene_type:complete